MATVPSSRTWVAGEVVTDAMLNQTVRDVENFLLAPPIFQGRQTAAQSLTSGTYAALTLDAEDVDSAGGHSIVTNTSRYAAVYAGWANVNHSAAFASNATGRRLAKLRMGGSTDVNASDVSMNSGVTNILKVTGPTMKIFFNVNDYVETLAAQESGGALNTAVTTVDQSMMGYEWISN
jgi:hypothetical protein